MDGVRSLLEHDLLAADFLAAMFWSAMSGFRHDTILRPFPPAFVGEQEHKNIEELVHYLSVCLPHSLTIIRTLPLFHRGLFLTLCLPWTESSRVRLSWTQEEWSYSSGYSHPEGLLCTTVPHPQSVHPLLLLLFLLLLLLLLFLLLPPLPPSPPPLFFLLFLLFLLFSLPLCFILLLFPLFLLLLLIQLFVHSLH